MGQEGDGDAEGDAGNGGHTNISPICKFNIYLIGILLYSMSPGTHL